jgi:hypothetical protein
MEHTKVVANSLEADHYHFHENTAQRQIAGVFVLNCMHRVEVMPAMRGRGYKEYEDDGKTLL